jgi:hypothetical protein
MRRRQGHRTAAVLIACVIHAVLLGALAIGIPWKPLVGPAEPVLQVTLERPPPQLSARPPPEGQKPRTKQTPQASPPAAPALLTPHVEPSAVPGPEIDAGEKAAAGDVLRALRATVGCANPDAVGLSPAERAACRKAMRATLGDVKPMSGLTAAKRERFDRTVRCHEALSASMPPARAGNSAIGSIPGMGDSPRLRDCPPWER